MDASEQTVFIVDDDEGTLTTLRAIVESVQLRTEAARSAAEFFEKCDESRSGCIVVDVRMPGMSGLELLDSLAVRRIELPVIVMSGFADVPMVLRAVKSGALDFLEKPIRAQELLDRIYAALRLDARRRSSQEQARLQMERYESLTFREREVLRLMVAGLSGKQIAAELKISYKTVEKFRGRVIKKMCAGSVAELVLMAVSLGLVPSAD